MVKSKKQNYIVWNAARNEAFVTDEYKDAETAVNGGDEGSTVALAFNEAYSDEDLKIEVLK